MEPRKTRLQFSDWQLSELVSVDYDIAGLSGFSAEELIEKKPSSGRPDLQQ